MRHHVISCGLLAEPEQWHARGGPDRRPAVRRGVRGHKAAAPHGNLFFAVLHRLLLASLPPSARMPHAPPPETLPPDVLPPDFLERPGLVHRLAVAPLAGLTPPHPWRPMTDAEWEWVRPHLPGTATAQRGPGRPMADARVRTDAIFRAVTLKRPRGRGRRP